MMLDGGCAPCVHLAHMMYVTLLTPLDVLDPAERASRATPTIDAPYTPHTLPIQWIFVWNVEFVGRCCIIRNKYIHTIMINATTPRI